MSAQKSKLETDLIRSSEKPLPPAEMALEDSLRPECIGDFIGQQQIKEHLGIYIEAARRRKESLDHILFFGPPGLGKTTLAHIMAREMDTGIKITSGPALTRAGDLAGLLTHLEEGNVLFIDEIHRLNPVVEEYIYPAMEDFSIDIMIDKGPHSRSVRLNLPKFTLIGATTRSGLLTSPLRARFGIIERISYYTFEELTRVVLRSAKILKVNIAREGAEEIARRARGTPRIANRLLKRIRDFADVRAQGVITKKVAEEGLTMLAVDTEGLDDMDRRVLNYILKEYDGGPVGVNALAAGLQEDAETLEEIYEPYLIQRGFLKRTSAGRVLTRFAYQHLGIEPAKPVSELWK